MNIVAVRFAAALSLCFALAACSGGSGGGGTTDYSGEGSYTGSDGSSGSVGGSTSQPSTPETEDPAAQDPATEDPGTGEQSGFDPVSVSLSWNIPSTRENGDPLAIADLGGYEIYYYREGEDPNSDCCVVTIDDPQATSFDVQITEAGTYYFAIAAYDNNNIFSDLSEPVSAVF